MRMIENAQKGGLNKIPNIKHQYPNKSQLPMSKTFGHLNLVIRYYLEFGIWLFKELCTVM
jgi:hypothetical protein